MRGGWGDWARGNHLDLRGGKAGEVWQSGNGTIRLLFSKDSRVAEVNGVKVCLSYPMLWRDGAAYIATMDLETAIGPVLFPPKNWKGSKVRNIVIDPGHGGKDPGNQNGSHQEKKYTLLLAQELAKQLNLAGFNASLTRTGIRSLTSGAAGYCAAARGRICSSACIGMICRVTAVWRDRRRFA